MRVLVIGSGGREHALVWKLAQSPRVEKIFCAPGNGGISRQAECVAIAADDVQQLAEFARRERIDLTVVGPEAPLSQGIVDVFQERGLLIFGPTKSASQLESSKLFAKTMMKKYGIPTAAWEVFSDPQAACAYVRAQRKPLVIKADGLCAGKGVFVCPTLAEQEQAIRTIMEDNAFQSAGDRVIIEDLLVGEEASIIVLSDGRTVLPLATSQDHKRIGDGDTGPNTGGMGAYSPAPVITPELSDAIVRDVILPTMRAMEQENIPYTGVLYAGIMVTADGPRVLEFNVRLGDPETQAIVPRLKTDLAQVLMAAARRELSSLTLEWDRRSCVCVVLAAGGYPGAYAKDSVIHGLDDITGNDVVAFHAGTAKKNGNIVTSGGRVLGITGLGAPIDAAIAATYAAVRKVSFEGMTFRTDIARKALCRANGQGGCSCQKQKK